MGHGKTEHIRRNFNVKIVRRLLKLVKIMKFHTRAKHVQPAVLYNYNLCGLCWKNIGQLPRVSGEDPERIRVDSVFETSVCLFFDCLLVSKFTLFLYYKVL